MKILFVQPNLITGGVEKSLINLMRVLSENNDVSLFLLSNSGEMFSQIPNKVKLISTEDLQESTVLNFKKYNKKFRHTVKVFLKKIGLFNMTLNHLACKNNRRAQKILSNVKIDGKYDIVVSFHGLNSQTNYLALENVDAKRRVVFFHGDAKAFRHRKMLFEYYPNFDNIFTVSRSCKTNFDKIFPYLASKTDFLYNLQNENEIVEKSKLFEAEYDKNTFNVVSVSRLTEEKGLPRSLKVIRKLAKENIDFCWNIVGSGDDERKIKDYISKHNLQPFVKMHGNQNNPYPYIKNADLTFLGSYHEACPMVLFESLILGTPILTTNTCSAKEIVGECGLVCENNASGIYKGFKQIFKNKKLLDEKKKKAMNFKFDQKEMLEKIYKNFS